MSFWDKIIELIQRSSLGLAIFLRAELIEWWDDKVKGWKALQRWWKGDESTDDVATRAEGPSGGISALDSGKLHEQIAEELREADKEGGLMGFVRSAVIVFGASTGAWQAFLAGISNLRAQRVNADLRPSLAGIETVIRAWLLNPELEPSVDDTLKRWGMPDNQIEFYKLASQNLLTGAELLTLINRELVSEDAAIAILRRQGYGRDDAERLVELRKFYPGPADWATLAGREAFEEDQIRDFQLDKGFDQIDPGTYERAGMTREVARWYWAAHWSNPSIQQLFEMIHRQAPKSGSAIWTEDDVEDYARLADINPIFVKGLTHIAFRPLTRVDVRRMRQDNVLTYDQVERNYLDLGYNPEDAQKMADWTEAWATRQERSLTRTQLENLYELRQITRTQLADLLESIGYSEDQASTISMLQAAEREEKRLKSFIARAEYEYKRQIEGTGRVTQILISEGIEPAQIGEMLEEWDNERVVQQALPSKDDLMGWLTEGIIAQGRFRSGMRALRYSDEDIDLYSQSDAVRLSKTDLLRLLDQEAIILQRALDGLAALGYNTDDARALTLPILSRIMRRKSRE